MTNTNGIKMCIAASIACVTVFITRRIFCRRGSQIETERDGVQEEKEHECGHEKRCNCEVNKRGGLSPAERMILSPVSSIGGPSTPRTASATDFTETSERQLLDTVNTNLQNEISGQGRKCRPTNKKTAKAVEMVAGRRRTNPVRRPSKLNTSSRAEMVSAIVNERKPKEKRNRADGPVADNKIMNNVTKHKGMRGNKISRRVAPQRIRETRTVAGTASPTTNNE